MKSMRPLNVMKTGEEAREYAAIPCVGQYLMAHLCITKAVEKWGARVTHAVDFGCGAGKSTRALRKTLGAGPLITGVDISDKMIDEARLRSVPGEPTSFHKIADAFAGQLPVKNESADLVVSTIVFQELQSQAEVEKAFEGISKCLRCDGRFVGVFVSDRITTEKFTAFTYDEFQSNATRKDNYRMCRSTLSGIVWTKDRHWSLRTLKQLLGKVGLTVIHVEYPLAPEVPPFPSEPHREWCDEVTKSPLLVITAVKTR